MRNRPNDIQRSIPKEHHVFPSWFVWFFLIPIVGFVFQWMMLPFGIPMTIKNMFKKNQQAIHDAQWLFKIGLAQVMLASLGLLVHVKIASDIFAIAGIVLWVAYWVWAVRFHRKYLCKTCVAA
jgi:hypothetical protein